MRVINRAVAAANVAAAVTTAQVFPCATLATAPAAILHGGSGKFTGKSLVIRATGSATTVDADTTVLISLYAVKNAIPSANPLAVASYTLLKASTARVVNASTAAWCIEAKLIYDAIGKTVHGTAAHIVNNLYDAHAALTNPLVLDDSEAEPAMTLVVAITFGVNAKATNIGRMTEFVMGF